MRSLLVPLILAVWLSGPGHGLTIGGRLTSSVYGYEGQQNATTRHVRTHQGLRLDVGRMAVPELSLHLYLRGTTDVSRRAETDPRLRIYHAYVKWEKNRYSLHLGRQRVSAGVGYGSIDGGPRAPRGGWLRPDPVCGAFGALGDVHTCQFLVRRASVGGANQYGAAARQLPLPELLPSRTRT